MATLIPTSSGLKASDYSVRALDGTRIPVRWYEKVGVLPGSAVVYAHGGGMVAGSVHLYDELVSYYVSETGVPFLSVDYRLAPEAKGRSLAEDVFAALLWLLKHAPELHVDPSRIAVMGDSGGGGPTAAAAILARERDIRLALQILVYPMLDDRNIQPGPLPADVLTWSYDNNFTGWNALLGSRVGGPDVTPIEAPGRLTDFSGLAPAYLDVGDLDIFRDEVLRYSVGLAGAGVPVELHLHPGAPHGFERFAPSSRLAHRAMADRARVVKAL